MFTGQEKVHKEVKVVMVTSWKGWGGSPLSPFLSSPSSYNSSCPSSPSESSSCPSSASSKSWKAERRSPLINTESLQSAKCVGLVYNKQTINCTRGLNKIWTLTPNDTIWTNQIPGHSKQCVNTEQSHSSAYRWHRRLARPFFHV